MYDDGAPGEIFITMAKEGFTISGLMDAFATAVSFNLQYGVPLKFLVDKFAHVRFEPSGWTGDQQIPYAKSIMDYIFRWLGAKFLSAEYAVTEAGETPNLRPTEADPQQDLPFNPVVADAPLCAECGSIMTRNGSCSSAAIAEAPAAAAKFSSKLSRWENRRPWHTRLLFCATGVFLREGTRGDCDCTGGVMATWQDLIGCGKHFSGSGTPRPCGLHRDGRVQDLILGRGIG